ncbi:MAG: peptidoglycan-binding domain-containing protein [Pseudomonadota bacterium]
MAHFSKWGPTMSKTAASIAVAFVIMLTSMTATAQESATPEDVAIAQGLLTRLGFDPGPVNGVNSDRTNQAIQTFHEVQGIDLPPGESELLSAIAVKNLMTAFVGQLMEPPESTSDLFHAATAGDGDAAIELGFMYFQGNSVAEDPMLAYLWWTVAESTGTSRVLNLKDWIKSSGKISDHEITCARRLVVLLSDAVRSR